MAVAVEMALAAEMAALVAEEAAILVVQLEAVMPRVLMAATAALTEQAVLPRKEAAVQVQEYPSMLLAIASILYLALAVAVVVVYLAATPAYMASAEKALAVQHYGLMAIQE
jgi:hypothetical protein